MKCQLYVLLMKYTAVTTCSSPDGIIILNGFWCFDKVVNGSVKQKGICIDMILGTEIQDSFVGDAVSSLHRCKGRGGDTKSRCNIFVVDLGVVYLKKDGLKFHNNGLKVVHSAIIGKYMRLC